MSTTTTEKNSAAPPAVTEQRLKPGEKWQSKEVQHLPENNLKIIVPALTLTIFLGALDQTIVATALPTIVKDIGGDKGYSWIGSAYMLMSASLTPLWGRLSDVIGRKICLHFSIFVFLLGSALCGAAQSFVWLAVCRGLQGAGAGGTIQMVLIVIADIVPLEERGKFAGYLGATWGVSSVIGPLVGGVLSDHASWSHRWAFWINLPIGGIAAAMLMFLKLNPRPSKTFMQHVREFDFIGLSTLTAGVSMLLVGFNFGETSWSAPRTIALLVAGSVLILFACVFEHYTTRPPILPPRLFKTRSPAVILLSSFIHSFAFFAASYFVPLYFQILGASATMSGVKSIPMSVGGSIMAILCGIIITRTKRYRPIIWTGWFIGTLGTGLMIMMSDTTSIAVQEILILIAGVGTGMLFQPALIALQASMPLEMVAVSTAAFGLVRTLGGTIGIQVGGSIFSSEVQRRMRRHLEAGVIPANIVIRDLQRDVHSISRIEDPVVRQLLQHEFTKSISVIWIVCVPLMAVGCLSVTLLRDYSLQRKTVRGTKGEPVAEGSDPAKAEEEGKLSEDSDSKLSMRQTDVSPKLDGEAAIVAVEDESAVHPTKANAGGIPPLPKA